MCSLSNGDSDACESGYKQQYSNGTRNGGPSGSNPSLAKCGPGTGSRTPGKGGRKKGESLDYYFCCCNHHYCGREAMTMIGPCSTRRRCVNSLVLGLAFGFLLGLVFLLYVACTRAPSPPGLAAPGSDGRGENDTSTWIGTIGDGRGDLRVPGIRIRKPLYVGVMTMPHHLTTRALSCYDTWAQDPLISTLEFFTRAPPHAVTSHGRLPLIQLKGKLSCFLPHIK